MKKNNKIINRIIDCLVLIAFAYIPEYLLSTKIDLIYDIYALIIYILIIGNYCYFIFKKQKKSIPPLLIIITIMQLIPLIATLTYGDHSMYKRGIRILLGSISAFCIIDYNFSYRKKEFLESIIYFLGFFVISNIITFFIFYPEMMDNIPNFYILGNDNGSIYETFTFIYISLLYYSMYNKKIPVYFYIVFFIILLGYFYVKSGNGMLCLSISALFLFYIKTKYIKKKISIKPYLAIYTLLFFIVVLLQDNNIFMIIAQKLFNKSPTISGRTIIWGKCLNYTTMHPIMGNGYESEMLVMSKIGNSKAHNVIIQYLYTGGITTLTLFLVNVGLVLKSIKNNRLNIRSKNIMNFSIFLFFIISLFDFYTVKFTTVIMLSIYYLIGKKEIKKT